MEINSENAKQKFMPFSICYTTSITLHKNKHCQTLWASFNLLICKTEQEQQPHFIALLLDTDQRLCQHDTVSMSKRQAEEASLVLYRWGSRGREGFVACRTTGKGSDSLEIKIGEALAPVPCWKHFCLLPVSHLAWCLALIHVRFLALNYWGEPRSGIVNLRLCFRIHNFKQWLKIMKDQQGLLAIFWLNLKLHILTLEWAHVYF